MPKAKNHRYDYTIYVFVRVLVCILQAMPMVASFRLARGLAWLVHKVDKRHRQVAMDNLRHAFPLWTEAKRAELVRQCYDHFLLMFIEMLWIARKYHRNTINQYMQHVEPENYDSLDKLAKARTCLLLTGHFGNWEALSYFCGFHGYRGGVIARRLDNQYLDQFLARFRRNAGQEILDKNKDYAKIQSLLSSQYSIGIVGDQDAGAKGMFVSFFHRQASTFKSIALLSLEYQAPIIVVGAARTRNAPPLFYKLHVPAVIYPEDFVNHPDPARAMTEEFTQALEQLIRLHPEQYFWLHRRWKHSPPAKKMRSAA